MKKITFKKLAVSIVFCLAAVFFGPAPVRAASTDPIQNGSVGLEAKVPANPPTTGGTITIPSNGQVFTTLPITVSGICPDGLLVKLFKNDVFSGSVQCIGGSFSLKTDLFSNRNDLVVRVYDALDQAGPDSNTVTVTFQDSSFGNNSTRVSLTSNYAKRGANPGDTLTWPIILSGGTAPYAASVDWGDGQIDLISRTSGGTFDIKHIYATPGVYNILIKITDTTGATAFLQLVAIANGPLSQDTTGGTSSTTVTNVVVVWWPMILAAALIIVSYWLGGQNRLYKLRKEMEKRVRY